ncbi:polysaccharide pyruvyl transferase family protein [Rothia sp. 88186D007BW]
MSVCEIIQSQIDDSYRRALKGATQVILLDQPFHRNLGDTFIWQGQLDTLKRLGVKVVYRSSQPYIEQRVVNSLSPDIPILLHGGGNMGDLWPAHEKFRQDVVELYPNRHIIILPQTIYFKSEINKNKAQEVYSKNTNVTIMVRDSGQIDKVQDMFPSNEIIYCPDSALGISYRKLKAFCALIPVVEKKLRVIQREDIESCDKPIIGRSEDIIGDWEFGPLNSILWQKLPSFMNRFTRNDKIPTKLLILTNHIQSEIVRILNMSAAVFMYKKSHTIVTNRLHGHIFACMLGIPNYVSDNNYGKISAIYEDYTYQFSFAKMFRGIHEAYSFALDSTKMKS